MNFQTFKKLYLGDYTNEGYDYGLQDGETHRPKNRFRFFKAVHPVNLIWNFNNSWESFQRTYDKGYIDGERVRHHIYDNQNQSKGGSVSSIATNSAQHRIKLIDDFENEIKKIKPKLEKFVQDYERQIRHLANKGFEDEYIQTLQEKHKQFESKLKDALDSLEKSLRTAKEQKEYLEKRKRKM